MEKPKVRISVRNLVEFILRSGDLDNSRGSSGDKEAMLKGGRLHRKIQRSMKGNYQAEVSLKRYDTARPLSAAAAAELQRAATAPVQSGRRRKNEASED